MTEFFAAADESGIQDDAEYCLVAGFVGSLRQWKYFESDWVNALKKYAIPEFHSKRFFGRNQDGRRLDHYKSWTDDKAVDFLQRLLSSIQKRQLYPVGAAIDTAAFFALTEGERRFLTGGFFTENGRWLSHGAPSRPYFLALQHFIIEALNATPESSSVHFAFDRQKQFQSRALEMMVDIEASAQFRELSDAEPDYSRIASRGFFPRTYLVGLQAADLLVNAWYSFFSRGYALSPERRVALNALTTRKEGMETYDAGHLEVMLSRLPSDVREKLKASIL